MHFLLPSHPERPEPSPSSSIGCKLGSSCLPINVACSRFCHNLDTVLYWVPSASEPPARDDAARDDANAARPNSNRASCPHTGLGADSAVDTDRWSLTGNPAYRAPSCPQQLHPQAPSPKGRLCHSQRSITQPPSLPGCASSHHVSVTTRQAGQSRGPIANHREPPHCAAAPCGGVQRPTRGRLGLGQYGLLQTHAASSQCRSTSHCHFRGHSNVPVRSLLLCALSDSVGVVSPQRPRACIPSACSKTKLSRRPD